MSKDKYVNSMTQGSILRLLILYALPLIGGNIFQQAYNLVDAIIVGRILGPDALAAVGSTSSVHFLIFGFCTGVSVGITIPIANRFGAEDFHTMRQYIFIGAIITAVMAAVFAVGASLLCGNILDIMRVPEKIYRDSFIYLLVMLLGIPFTLLYNYLASILRAVGNSRTPFVFLVISSMLNIVLDLVFILYLGLGVMGAALATVVAQAISGILCLILIALRFEILHPRREDRAWNNRMMLHQLNMGIPMGLQFSITAIGVMIVQAINNATGLVYTTAYSGAMKVENLLYAPLNAFATATATFSAQNHGARAGRRIIDGVKTGLMIMTVYSLFCTAALWLGGKYLLLLVFDPAEVEITRVGILYLRWLGSFYVFLGILEVIRQVVQALGWSKRAMGAGAIELLTRIFVGLVVVRFINIPIIYIADPASWITATLYLIPITVLCIRAAVKSCDEQTVKE